VRRLIIIMALLVAAHPGHAMDDAVDFSNLCNEQLPDLFPLLEMVPPLESIGNNADAANLVTLNSVQNNASNSNPVTANPVTPKDNQLLHTTIAKVIVKKSHPRAQPRPGMPDEQGNLWYHCDYCEKKFSDRRYRWIHERKSCSQAEPDIKVSSYQKYRPGIPDEQGSMWYDCRYCERRFSNCRVRWNHEHKLCPQAKAMNWIATADDVNRSTMLLDSDNNDDK
jgi:hypothetical protein